MIVMEAILLKMTITNGHYKEGSKEKQQDSNSVSVNVKSKGFPTHL